MQLFGNVPYKMQFLIVLLFITLVLGTGCSSPLTGCSSNQMWYQEGKSPNQTMRDLAACQNQALVNGQSFSIGNTDNGTGRAVAVGMIDAGFERKRENQIVRTGMLAKGYTLVDKNSPLLSESQSLSYPNPSSQQDARITAMLLGHWESVSITGTQKNNPAAGAYVHTPQNMLKEINALQVKNGNKPYPDIASAIADGQDPKIAMPIYINPHTGKDVTKYALQPSLASDTGGLSKLEVKFMERNQLIARMTKNGTATAENGNYRVQGDKLTMWVPADDSDPDKVTLSFTNDGLIMSFSTGVTVTFQKH
jgi:hypothetical protein